tara:strand:+ start:95 stop:511 length:417 start_codon:yes stop_codon:yes gene_type:complete
MRDATFCLTPAGDNYASARFYTAIAAGCLPVVVADPFTGAFPLQAKYDTFWVKAPQEAFIRDPASLLRTLRAMPAAEVAARQRAMAAHRADVLYDVVGTRVGTNLLLAAADSKCFQGARNASLKLLTPSRARPPRRES